MIWTLLCNCELLFQMVRNKITSILLHDEQDNNRASVSPGMHYTWGPCQAHFLSKTRQNMYQMYNMSSENGQPPCGTNYLSSAACRKLKVINNWTPTLCWQNKKLTLTFVDIHHKCGENEISQKTLEQNFLSFFNTNDRIYWNSLGCSMGS